YAHRRRNRRRLRSPAAGRPCRPGVPVVAHQVGRLSPDPAGGPAVRLSIVLAVLLVATASLVSAEPTAPLAFERGSWTKLRASHDGQPTVIHFWGLTCGPCLVELPHWGKLRQERPDLRLVLIAADPLPQDPDRVSATLEKAGLAGSESWSFTDRFYERLRYE